MIGVAPFVGRQAEQLALRDLLDRARSSAGGVVVLTGAAGIGKTRLADEVATQAQGFLVVAVTCGPAGTAPPFWPWRQLLADLLRRAEGLRAQAEREWPAALRLADPRRASDPVGPQPDHAGARAELYDDIVSLLAAAAGPPGRPLLLVIDDLQNGDPSSWLLLAHLVPRLRSLPIVVVVTWRTGDLRTTDPVATALLRQARVIAVPPLEVDQLGSLLASVAGEALDPEVAAAVHRRTSGNPLLAQEVIAALQAGGGPAGVGAVTTAVPESIRAVVHERVAALPPGTGAPLVAAAALGLTFPVGVLGEACGLTVMEVLEALGPALSAGVLQTLGPAEGTFAHELVRDVVGELSTPAARARLHEQLARAFERRQAAGQPVEPVDLARHFLAAGPTAAREARRYATEAGRRAMTMYAYEDAARWFTRALGVAGAGMAEDGRATLLLALGEAQEAKGDRAAARRTYLDAAATARAAGRADLLAAAALGMSGTVGFEVAMLDHEQIDLLREALATLAPEERARRASVMARLAVAVSFLEGPEPRARLSTEAIALARLSGDPFALVQALAAHCDAIAGPEHVEARLELAGEIVEIGARTGQPPLELLGRRLAVVARLEAADIAGADREIRAFATRAAALRRPAYGWYVPLWRSMRALMDGRIDEASAAMADAERGAGESDSANAAMLTTTLRWVVLSELDHVEEIREMLATSGLEDFPGVWPLVVRALCAAQLGQPAPAAALLDTAAAHLPEAERDSEWLPMLCQVSEVVALIGAHPVAAWAYDSLLPFRSYLAVEGIGAAVRGPVERALGVLAAALGRPDDAAGHFQAALAQAEGMGAGLIAARTLRDAGVALDDAGRLQEARRRYAALGVERRVAELDALLAAGPAAGAGEDLAGNVFRREGEFWRLVHAGREVRLRDSKGMRDLGRLLAEPGRPFPAVDLAAGAGTVLHDHAEEGLHAPGDLGEVVDAQARAAYRRRLAELEEEIDDADRAADIGRSARASAEKDALVAQLAAAYGLAGRPRRAGDPAERARQAVTARVRDALGRVETAHPDLGRHLRRSVRTGRICVYEPDSPITWSV